MGEDTFVAENPINTTPTSFTAGRGKNAGYSKGRTFSRFFSCSGVNPFESVEWETREVSLKNDKGQVIYHLVDIEAPKSWSQTAINVVASKYFSTDKDGDEREHSIRDLVGRVVTTICRWGEKDSYFAHDEDKQTFRSELIHILLNQYASFNSPVWFNVGVRENPQCSACFIISVNDSLDSLLDLQRTEAMLFKYGSGTGTNLSTLRSTKEKLKGGGIPSGPVSFMRGFDAWAGIVKSGGKTRRAAKMQILNVSHPDIVDFITCKATEEKKSWALIEQGYDGGFAVPGGAYDSVFFQNANLSARVTDEFMEAAEHDRTFSTRRVTDNHVCEHLSAKEVLRLIAESTYICGDPGLQFDTTINSWHTCPNSGRINASNPCSEYMHLDNSACNLSSINLLKFLRNDGSFDTDAFCHVVDILITAQDILIDNSSYPTEKIGRCAREFRQLGLGFANLGALLMSLGVPYDSDEGREWAAAITALMTGQAYKTSSLLAKEIAPFAGFKKNKKAMLAVIERHRSTLARLSFGSARQSLADKAATAWSDCLTLAKTHGFRNSQTTVLAPTGTISFMMDCDTTGIEPDLALVKYKRMVGGGLIKLVNRSVDKGLSALGYTTDAILEITAHIEKAGTIENSATLNPEHLPVFDCALTPQGGNRSIHYMGHLRMMAAVQPFLSGAISKTVNLPSTVTVADIIDIYHNAWKLGLKAVALYRDGSKRTQPLSTTEHKTDTPSKPMRRRLPDERRALTHKFNVCGLEGYLTVGLFEDGSPGEIFLVVAKEGSTLSGVMDAFATSVSIALQYGVPLSALVKKFSYMRFEPSGFTQNQEIPMAHSVIDYVFRWLGLKFLSDKELSELGLLKRERTEDSAANDSGDKKSVIDKAIRFDSNGSTREIVNGTGHAQKSEHALLMSTFHNSADAPPCTSCGSSMMVRQAGCYVCLNCGSQGGCG